MSEPILGASAVEPLPDDSWQQKWRCAACESSYAFYSGNPRFLAYCTNCVMKIRAHAADPKNSVNDLQDTPEAWQVVIDHWLDNGSDLPDGLSAKFKAEYNAWLDGGPSTPGALRYGRSRRPAR